MANKYISTWWWTSQPNFGDALCPWIFRKLGYEPVQSESEDRRLLLVGSILRIARRRDVVCGVGAFGRTCPPATVTVLATRGSLCCPAPLHFDSGIAVAAFISRRSAARDVALVPHWSEVDLVKERFPDHFIIDPRQDVDAVLDQIATSGSVLASSLHGLVVADALGIPARAVTFVTRPVKESSSMGCAIFKFRDYGVSDRPLVLFPKSVKRISLSLRPQPIALALETIKDAINLCADSRHWTDE